MLSPPDHVGPCGMLSPSDSDSVGPVGPCGTLSPSDPVGPCGMLSPSGSDYVGPCGTLSPSDFDSVGPVGPCGTLSPSDSDNIGPLGPLGTLSMAGAVSDGPTGQVEMTTVVACLGKETSSADHARRALGELIPGICADLTICKDPVISFLPAVGPVGDVRHTGDMDVMRDSYPAVPDIGDCRAVVALVGLDAAQKRDETLREYGNDCVEWDIRKEF